MDDRQRLTHYLLRLGDNALILGQRLVELVASGPELEEELANANFALDYLGQARLFYSYAGELEGRGRDEDDFAFLRREDQFRNFLLVEQPNGHFGDTVVRQFLFDAWYLPLLGGLAQCSDARLAEIAARAQKEIRYHLRHSSQWLIRLGDGTEESHGRVQASLDGLWRYTGEMFAADDLDRFVCDGLDGPDPGEIEAQWRVQVDSLLEEATLATPPSQGMASGGRSGRHSEHFGYLVAEMQYMQRAYPGLSW